MVKSIVTKQFVNSAEAIESLESVAEWLDFAESELTTHPVFFGHGYVDAQTEAQLLMSGALGLTPDELPNRLTSKLAKPARVLLFESIQERVVKRLPLAYITGEIWFHGQRFLSDSRALVPRSLIVELLDSQIAPWIIDPEKVHAILDLCTGGGSIAIFASQAFPEAKVWASDISTSALSLAQENLNLYQSDSPNIQLIESSLYDKLTDLRFDLILCNPPYVNANSMEQLPAEYLHEPNLALAGGNDGMDLIRDILGKAPEHLNEHGLLVLEIGNEALFFEAAFNRLEFAFIPVEAGDDMVIAVTREAIVQWRNA